MSAKATGIPKKNMVNIYTMPMTPCAGALMPGRRSTATQTDRATPSRPMPSIKKADPIPPPRIMAASKRWLSMARNNRTHPNTANQMNGL